MSRQSMQRAGRAVQGLGSAGAECHLWWTTGGVQILRHGPDSGESAENGNRIAG